VATPRSAVSAPRRRIRRRAALVGVVVVPWLTACGSGFHAESNQIYQPGPGITVRHQGGVYTLNAFVVTDGNGHGTLVGALINQRAQPDALVSVRTSIVPSGKALKTTLQGGPITLAPHHSVQLANSGAVRLEGALAAGSYVSVTLTFRQAAPIKVEIPILSRSAEFDKVPVGPTRPSGSGSSNS
jgi:copper(I)-binding protein